MRGRRSKVRDPFAAKATRVTYLLFCTRSHGCLIHMCEVFLKTRLAHPCNRNGPLTAKAPFLLTHLQSVVNLEPTNVMQESGRLLPSVGLQEERHIQLYG